MNYPKVILKSGKDQSVRRYHPWIFSGAIKKIIGHVNEGDLVYITDNKDEFLAIGHYQIGSIAVRILTFEQKEIDDSFWKEKISSAYNLRKTFGLAENDTNNVYRLVHAEGDGLPGLIIDYYNGTAVLQMHSIGMYLNREHIVQALKDIYGSKLTAIYDKSESTIPFKSKIEAKNGYVYGQSGEPVVLEYGNKFKVSWEEGQKTGFFIDQRENRKLLADYSKNRSVLNVFGYTGGFSVYAMHGGANVVHSVDSSKKAIDLTNENIALNFPDDNRHEAFAVDAFEFLNDIDNKYDLIILDPPAFAKHHNVLHNALQGYKRLNAKAIEKIKPGGILFTFSCSQVVSKENFRKTIFTAAANTGRSVRILHQLSQPIDHPVNIYHPESEYLKGLVVYVE
ncbi:MAG: class I SAM-dependent rRNA methyltransferase [Bacteroidetes bacterium]|nr:class I SAM-dependent rRNA methyltransferase [Bacteroidota bacterium]